MSGRASERRGLATRRAGIGMAVVSTAVRLSIVAGIVALASLMLAMGMHQNQGVNDGAAGLIQDDIQIDPDPSVQEEIDRIIRRGKEIDDSSSSREALQVLDGWIELERRVGPATLVPQLVYYSMHGENILESMAFEYALHLLNFADRLEEATIASALIPYLATRDPELKKQITGYLRHTEDWRNGRPDYSHYRSLVAAAARAREALPRPLIRYMYESHPAQAVLTMLSAFPGQQRLAADDRKLILWAEHQVADVLWKWRHGFLPQDKVEPEAAKALADLVHHEQWWVRLYVAETIRQHPQFRTDEAIAILLLDPDESVRSVVQTFVPEEQLSPNM